MSLFCSEPGPNEWLTDPGCYLDKDNNASVVAWLDRFMVLGVFVSSVAGRFKYLPRTVTDQFSPQYPLSLTYRLAPIFI